MENDSLCRCRLCLNTSEEFICIFDEETNEILPEISDLLQTMQLTIESQINKSEIMCMKCHVKLSDFKEFRNNCEENEKVWDQICADMEMNLKVEYLHDIIEEPLPVVVKRTSSKGRKKKVRRVKKTAAEELSPVLDVVDSDDTEAHDAQSKEDDAKLEKFYAFSCPICEPTETFSTIYTYRYHMKMRHGVKNAKISCCNRNLSKRYELLDHMAFHIEPQRLACKICQKVCSDRKNMAAHIKRMHSSDVTKKWQCDICKKRFAGYEPLKSHMITHLSAETREDMKTHLCNECGQTFISPYTLTSHIKYVHLKKGFICVSCGRHFKARFDYDLHRRNAHGEIGPSRVQCNICHNWYSNEKALRDHVRYLHQRTDATKIVCQLCGQELASKASLRTHMKIKHEEKTHRCNYCGKALPTAIRLKEHEAMHTGVSLYSCMYCPNKHFNMRSNMYKHLKAKHALEWERDKVDKNRNPEKWKKIEIDNE